MNPNKRNIVWLASYPKSGNTWFRILLTNLLSGTPSQVDFNDLQRIPISSDRGIIDNYLGLDSADLTYDEIRNLQPEVYKAISRESENLAFIKTHDAWGSNNNGIHLFPKEVTKGVIYIIRNPLDVAISYSFHSDLPYKNTIQNLNNLDYRLCSNTEKLKFQIPQNLGTWSNHVISWVLKSKLPVHTVRYEDMLSDTLGTFRGALEFLDLKYSNTKIETAIKNCSFKTLRTLEHQHGFNERNIHSKAFFRKGSIDEWKTKLTKSQYLSIVNQHVRMMTRFGYLDVFK